MVAGALFLPHRIGVAKVLCDLPLCEVVTDRVTEIVDLEGSWGPGRALPPVAPTVPTLLSIWERQSEAYAHGGVSTPLPRAFAPNLTLSCPFLDPCVFCLNAARTGQNQPGLLRHGRRGGWSAPTPPGLYDT